MDLYINGIGLICAAGYNAPDDFLLQQTSWHTNRLNALEPDYTALIPPMQLRRMSKTVRMGVAAAKTCLAHSGLDQPHALSVGTALGSLSDTEQFLSRMIEREEQQLTPTSFIQSTHNTVAGQIALLIGCNGHNLTFAHRGHSFEHALLNARMYLYEHPDHIVLTGGIDELIDTSVQLMQRGGVYCNDPVQSEELYQVARKGTVAGEGASFFSVSSQPMTQSYMHIQSVHLFVSNQQQEITHQLNQFYDVLPVRDEEVDMVVLGMNGDERWNSIYEGIRQNRFKKALHTGFKHLTGEYPTASAVGLGLLFNKNFSHEHKRIVFINNYLDHFSCWYIERH